MKDEYIKECCHCGEEIDIRNEEYDSGYNRYTKKYVFMCEECSDYADKSINHYENEKR